MAPRPERLTGPMLSAEEQIILATLAELAHAGQHTADALAVSRRHLESCSARPDDPIGPDTRALLAEAEGVLRRLGAAAERDWAALR